MQGAPAPAPSGAAPSEQARKEIHLEFAGVRPAGSDGEDSVTPTFSTSVVARKNAARHFRLTIRNKKRTYGVLRHPVRNR
jgi:hypothetical protein